MQTPCKTRQPSIMRLFRPYSIVFAMLIFEMIGCSKNAHSPDPRSKVQISAVSISGVGRNSIYCSATVSQENATVLSQGFCLDTLPMPDLLHSPFIKRHIGNNFSDTINGLKYGTRYYVRAWVETNSGAIYSQPDSVRTLGPIADIGQHFGGGFIFYLDSTGEHGLIAASKDIGRFLWQNCGGQLFSQNLIPPDTIGSGKYLTETIVQLLPAANAPCILAGNDIQTTAAEACYNLVMDGFDDWYLPSYTEMHLLSRWSFEHGIQYKDALSIDLYWSSTEIGADQAGFVPGSNAAASTWSSEKFNYWAVRPVRRF